MAEEDRLNRAHVAAMRAWASSNGRFRPPRGPLFGVRFPPRTNGVEIFAVTESHEPGDGLIFFAGHAPSQIYACAAFKCHLRASPAGFHYYVIIDSDEDLVLANKSPLRAIACNIAPNNTNVDERRVFAAKTAAPAVRGAFFN